MHTRSEDPGWRGQFPVFEAITENISQEDSIAAIVPAYNEAGRIGRVIAILCRVPSLAEIIIVDDGSKDGTAAEALRAAQDDPRVRVLRHSVNLGKGQALFNAWRDTSAAYLVFLDADLKNLKPDHVYALMEPVLSARADMTLGLFKNGYWRTDASHWLTPWLTGQRCIRAELLHSLDQAAAAGYGFETALTLAAGKQGWRCQKVALLGVSHPPGDIPRGSWRGPVTKVKMYAHILRAWALTGDWQEFMPRIARRVKFVVVLVLTFASSLINSCSVTPSAATNRVLYKWLQDDTFWTLWGKLKAAFEMLK